MKTRLVVDIGNGPANRMYYITNVLGRGLVDADSDVCQAAKGKHCASQRSASGVAASQIIIRFTNKTEVVPRKAPNDPKRTRRPSRLEFACARTEHTACLV